MDPVAAAALSELAVAAACDLDTLDAIAEHVWSERRGQGIEGLARGQGARVTHDHALPRPFRALLLDDEIIVRPCRDPAQVCAAIAHELAHYAAKRAKLSLAHPDVWRLTLAILVPKSSMTGGASVGDVAAATGAPWWAVERRMAQKRAA